MTTFTWTGNGNDDKWSDPNNWVKANTGITGVPGAGDTVEVPAKNASVEGQEEFTIETAGQTVGTFYGASIGYFPVYNDQHVFQYTGEVDSFTILEGGLTANDLYGVELDGGTYIVKGNAGSTSADAAIGFQDFSNSFQVGKIGPNSNAWKYGESEVELEEGTLTVAGSFAGEVDAGTASCDAFLGGIVNGGVVTAASAESPTVDGGSLTVSGSVTDAKGVLGGIIVNGGNLTVGSASGNLFVGEDGAENGTFDDLGSLTLTKAQPENWSGDVENGSVAIIHGATKVVAATFTVGVEPGGGTLELDKGLAISGVADPGGPYLTGLRDGDPESPGIGGTITVSGTTTVNLSAEESGSGIVINGPKAEATFKGAVELGETAFGNFEIDQGHAQISDSGHNALEAGAATILVSSTNSAVSKLQVTGNTLIGNRAKQTSKFTITGSAASATLSGNLTVGEKGDGALTVSQGATATITGNLELTPGAGGDDGAVATVTITGKKTNVTVTGAVDDGGAGDGSTDAVTVSGGASLSVGGAMMLGQNSDTSSTLTVTGSGSTLTVKGDLVVGDDGSASLIVDDGASLTVDGEIIIGDEGAASGGESAAAWDAEAVHAVPSAVKGVLKYDTPGKHTTLQDDCIVGDNEYGELDIYSGYTINANGKSITVGNQDHSDGNITISGAKSTLSGFSSIQVGEGGDGLVEALNGAIVSGNQLFIGGAAKTDAEVVVSNAKLTTDFLGLGIKSGLTGPGIATQAAGESTLTVSSNGSVAIQKNFIKGSGASFAITGGSVMVGSAPKKAGYLTVGKGGSADLYGAADKYSASTEIDGGALILESVGAAGSGSIAFKAGDLEVRYHGALLNSIADFNATDSLELRGVTATKKSFSNGVLTLLNGNTVVSKLQFVGSYDPLDFHVRESGGWAIVTYSAPGAAPQSAFDSSGPSHELFPSGSHDPLDLASTASTAWR